MKALSTLLMFVIFSFGILFSLLNPGKVHFDYLLGQHDLPLSMLLLGSFVMGILLGSGVVMVLLWRVKHQKRCLKRQLVHAQKEVDNLRSVPIIDGK